VHASVVQALPSSQSAAVLQSSQPGSDVMPQLPSGPHSSLVQGLLSLQSADVAHGTHPGVSMCAHVPLPVQTSVVQTFASAQSAAVVQGTQPGTAVPVQLPAWQLSPVVQASASSQLVPSAAAGFEQRPLAGSHVPATWHWSEAVHTTGLPPVQTPPVQLSVWVHASLSLHAVPSATTGLEHTPVAGSQEPAAWHWSAAVQTTGFVPVQVPPWQVSVWVQASPSLQLVPSGFAGFEQRPVSGSHVPAAWH